MQNLPPNEDALIRALKEADTPRPPRELLQMLQAAPKRHSRRWVWAIPATATVLTLALIPILTLPPTVSLAQVAKVADAQTQYTIVNTRLMNRGKESVNITTYRNKALWRRGNTFGLSDKTVTIRDIPNLLKYVLIDNRKEPEEQEFRVDRLLRPAVKPKVERNISWQGRTVNRYTIRDTYQATRTETFDQVVIVDARTNLPIRMTIMRDSGQWGDVWDYKFGAPPASVFEAKVPKGAQVYDLRQQRRQLPNFLGEGLVGGILVDDSRGITALLQAGEVKGTHASATIQIAGTDGFFIARVGEMPRLNPGSQPSTGQYVIGDRAWSLVSAFLPVPHWPRVDKLMEMKTATGTLTLDGNKIKFENVPVIRTGDRLQLLDGFETLDKSRPATQP